ncbi:hypothetical protein HPB48_010861 [Haemaphysalis longicornis]|uniref:WD repeat domain phosphoinositide-interacting protein 2 n=1 Tax=Haemaphysalis longicornis TaxID=44386 RepID=A0A9J6FU78_HAELO|nr:hypothetical protein HPB48_010861 [Haemaphysalis longicornis]
MRRADVTAAGANGRPRSGLAFCGVAISRPYNSQLTVVLLPSAHLCCGDNDCTPMQNLASSLNHLSKGVKHGVGGLMNLAAEGGDHPPYVVYVNFNQDGTVSREALGGSESVFSDALSPYLVSLGSHDPDEGGLSSKHPLLLNALRRPPLVTSDHPFRTRAFNHGRALPLAARPLAYPRCAQLICKRRAIPAPGSGQAAIVLRAPAPSSVVSRSDASANASGARVCCGLRGLRVPPEPVTAVAVSRDLKRQFRKTAYRRSWLAAPASWFVLRRRILWKGAQRSIASGSYTVEMSLRDLERVRAADELDGFSKAKFALTCPQRGRSLSVGTQTGYKFFSLTNVDKLEQIYENEGESICLVERLFLSSLVSIVGASSARKLKVCHFKKASEICNYSYSNSILAVRLNRARLVVCLEESLYIHNIRDMKARLLLLPFLFLSSSASLVVRMLGSGIK